VDALSPAATDEEMFAARSRLVHEWRMFLFRDPVLPRSLLPAAWPGDKAAAYFDSESSRLLPAARRFVDACLEDPRG
jgi:phenylacetic acid degradation operon negative regulatory protein